jgi:hypothetical protein
MEISCELERPPQVPEYAPTEMYIIKLLLKAYRAVQRPAIVDCRAP